MSNSFRIKQGTRKPDLDATLYDGAGAVINLTGSTVTFAMQDMQGKVIVADAAVTIVSAPTGQVRYEWAAADTAVVGRFQAEFHVAQAGKTTAVPSDGYLDIEVLDKIG
jgi:hypothetical protein